jgi:ERCC4-related helicase
MISTKKSSSLSVICVSLDSLFASDRLFNCLKSLSHKKTSHKGSDEARILIFALYKKEATRIEQSLGRAGYDVGALHGDMTQSARINALEKFKTGETGLLVATDVAARGLDIPNVGAVINYTFPLTLEDYIHRIGRTGACHFDYLPVKSLRRSRFQGVGGVPVNPSPFSPERITSEHWLVSLHECCAKAVSMRRQTS